MFVCSCKLFDRLFDSIGELNEDIEIVLYHYPYDDENQDTPWYQIYAKKEDDKYKFFGKVYIPCDTTVRDMFNAITLTCFRIIGIKSLSPEDIEKIISTDPLGRLKNGYMAIIKEDGTPADINNKINEYTQSHGLEEKFTMSYMKWLINNEEIMYDV